MLRTTIRTLKPFNHRCSFFSISTRRNVLTSGGSAAAAAGDDLLLDDVTETVKPLVEPTLLQPRVVVFDGVCHLCHGVCETVKPLVEPTLLQPRVVVYDGVCHLCHGGVKQVIRVDKHKKIKFCCLQSKAAEPYMRVCGVEREDVLRRFIFIEGPGVYHQGSAAALRVLSYLPLPYSALSSLMIVPRPIRDAAYDYIAKRRYAWFGKGDSCLVLQEKELLERFIDRDELIDDKESDS